MLKFSATKVKGPAKIFVLRSQSCQTWWQHKRSVRECLLTLVFVAAPRPANMRGSPMGKRVVASGNCHALGYRQLRQYWEVEAVEHNASDPALWYLKNGDNHIRNLLQSHSSNLLIWLCTSCNHLAASSFSIFPSFLLTCRWHHFWFTRKSHDWHAFAYSVNWKFVCGETSKVARTAAKQERTKFRCIFLRVATSVKVSIIIAYVLLFTCVLWNWSW